MASKPLGDDDLRKLTASLETSTQATLQMVIAEGLVDQFRDDLLSVCAEVRAGRQPGMGAVRVRGLRALIDMLSDDSPCNHCLADIGDGCRPGTPGCRTALLAHFDLAPEKTGRTDPQPFRGLHFDKDKLRAMGRESDAPEPEGGEPRE